MVEMRIQVFSVKQLEISKRNLVLLKEDSERKLASFEPDNNFFWAVNLISYKTWQVYMHTEVFISCKALCYAILQQLSYWQFLRLESNWAFQPLVISPLQIHSRGKQEK